MAAWDPWGHLEETDLRLIWAPLPHVDGAYDRGRRLVILHPGRTQTAQRSALAEELAHHELGHEPVTDPVETARTELRARRWAAIRLVSFDDLLEAVAVTPYFHEIAEMLEVDPDLLATRVDLCTESEQQLLGEAVARWEVGS